jgi:hypothetical protein
MSGVKILAQVPDPRAEIRLEPRLVSVSSCLDGLLLLAQGRKRLTLITRGPYSRWPVVGKSG